MRVIKYCISASLLMALVIGVSGLSGQPVLGTPIVDQEETPRGWDVGDLAIEFELPDVDGDLHALSQYLGKTVMLNFWGTGAYECGQVVAGVFAQDIYEMYEGSEDLVILGIDRDTPPDYRISHIRDEEIAYPVLVDEVGEVFSLFRIGNEFITLLIDPDGIIQFRDVEMETDNVLTALEELVGPPLND